MRLKTSLMIQQLIYSPKNINQVKIKIKLSIIYKKKSKNYVGNWMKNKRTKDIILSMFQL